MYKIIGTDGKEYGPINASQIRQWVAENRANAQTLVQPEGSTGWNPLGGLPEFSDLFSSKTPPPLSAPRLQSDADAIAAEILTRDYTVEIGSCFSRSWNLLMQNFWLLVGASFVLGLIQGAIGLLAGVCMGGLYFLLLKLIRGQRAEFSDGFAGFNVAFVQLFLAGLVSALLTSLGLILCILPGIFLAVAWMFTLPLVMDKKLDFWAAMELSRKVVSRHWWLIFCLALMNMLVMLLGVMACFVGVFIAHPLIFGATAYAYEDIFNKQNPPRGLV